MTTTEVCFSKDEDIFEYIDQCSKLSQVSDPLSITLVENVSDAGIKALLASNILHQLNNVSFNFCENINEAETLSNISTATNLQDLVFMYCPVLDNQALYHISRCSNITSLSAVGCVSTDPWTMKNISAMTGLKKLTINHNEYLTAEDIFSVSTLSNLEELDMEDIHLNNKSLFAILNGSGSTKLKRLNIEENPDVTTMGFHELTKLKNLEALRIGVCQATDVGWKSIGKLMQLTALQILGSTNLTNDGFENFVTELTRLKELQICFCDQLTKQFVHETITRLTSISRVSITDID